MTVTVLAFAQVRESLGFGEKRVDVREGSTVGELWDVLTAENEALGRLAAATRIACNGTIVERGRSLHEDDEVAFLPPVGGG